MIAATVFLLCALTSSLCATLLQLSYRRTRARLLFWSSLCFMGLALNNILLFVDRVILPEWDLAVFRTIPAVFGFAVLIWGFIWDT